MQIKSVGPAFPAQETVRVAKIKDGKVLADKKKMLELRLNILASFKSSPTEEL